MKVLFVCHQADFTGAPGVLLQVARWAKANTDAQIETLIIQSGTIESQFAELGPVTCVSRINGTFSRRVARKLAPGRWFDERRQVRSVIERVVAGDHDVMYVNSAACAPYAEALVGFRGRIVLHLHEMRTEIEKLDKRRVGKLYQRADLVIGVSEPMRKSVVGVFGEHRARMRVVPVFIDTGRFAETDAAARAAARASLELPADGVVVGSVGAPITRKGVDLFAQLAAKVKAIGGEPVRFIWIGGPPRPDNVCLDADVEHLGVRDVCRFVDTRSDMPKLYPAMDVLALLSREDPCPLAVLEAGAAGIPVVCFEHSGGAVDVVGHDGGAVVPYLDLDAAAQAIAQLAADSQRRRACGEAIRRRVRERHDVSIGAAAMWALIEQTAAGDATKPCDETREACEDATQ